MGTSSSSASPGLLFKAGSLLSARLVSASGAARTQPRHEWEPPLPLDGESSSDFFSRARLWLSSRSQEAARLGRPSALELSFRAIAGSLVSWGFSSGMALIALAHARASGAQLAAVEDSLLRTASPFLDPILAFSSASFRQRLISFDARSRARLDPHASLPPAVFSRGDQDSPLHPAVAFILGGPLAPIGIGALSAHLLRASAPGWLALSERLAAVSASLSQSSEARESLELWHDALDLLDGLEIPTSRSAFQAALLVALEAPPSLSFCRSPRFGWSEFHPIESDPLKERSRVESTLPSGIDGLLLSAAKELDSMSLPFEERLALLRQGLAVASTLLSMPSTSEAVSTMASHLTLNADDRFSLSSASSLPSLLDQIAQLRALCSEFPALGDPLAEALLDSLSSLGADLWREDTSFNTDQALHFSKSAQLGMERLADALAGSLLSLGVDPSLFFDRFAERIHLDSAWRSLDEPEAPKLLFLSRVRHHERLLLRQSISSEPIAPSRSRARL